MTSEQISEFMSKLVPKLFKNRRILTGITQDSDDNILYKGERIIPEDNFTVSGMIQNTIATLNELAASDMASMGTGE